jgi:hypothetical protein
MTLIYPRVKPLTLERAEELGADPRRQHLIDQILFASTIEEVNAALLTRHAWLVANPDDIGVLEIGELLAYLEEDLAEPEVPNAVTVAAPPSERRVRDIVDGAGVKPHS